MDDKVYEFVAVLRVYGQTSKQKAKDFLEEALHVDGVLVEKIGPATLVKESDSSAP